MDAAILGGTGWRAVKQRTPMSHPPSGGRGLRIRLETAKKGRGYKKRTPCYGAAAKDMHGPGADLSSWSGALATATWGLTPVPTGGTHIDNLYWARTE